LGTGGVIYQAQAGRPQEGAPARSGVLQVVQERRAEQGRAREEQLSAELEQARLEVRQLREQLERVRTEAEARAAFIESNLQTKREQWIRSQDALQLFREGDRPRAVAQAPAPEARPEPRENPNPAAEEMQKQKAEILLNFVTRRRALEGQLRALNEEERQMLERLEEKWTRVVRQRAAEALHQESPLSPPVADKLGQILERLEQMDRRLRKLEERQSRERRAESRPASCKRGRESFRPLRALLRAAPGTPCLPC
jgi:hypothetical protein